MSDAGAEMNQWIVSPQSGANHVMPLHDLREHTADASCWCHPIDVDGDGRVIAHNSMDRREEYDSGRMPS